MEEIDVNSAEFWDGPATRVFADPAFAGESAALKDALAAEEVLAGHLMFRTSGSEGGAKYVCLSKEALMISAEGVNRRLGVHGDDRWLRALPLHHVGGFGIHARARAAGGVAFAMEGRWDAARFVECCRAHAITLTSLVPAQVHDLITSEVPAPDSLRAIVVGGGTLREETGREARRRGWPVLQSYGLTEAGSQVATPGPETLELGGFRNARLPLLDIWEARTGARGVLELRGAALFAGYVRLDDRGELVREAPLIDGWFATGDRVTLEDVDGRPCLTFREREGEVVKILGELVSLQPLRERIERLAAEAGLDGRLALAAVEDGRRGTVLVLAHGPGLAEGRVERIRERFDEEVRGFERIAEARAVREIPRSALGKIRYGALAGLVKGE